MLDHWLQCDSARILGAKYPHAPIFG
jgi:hypothetical protein